MAATAVIVDSRSSPVVRSHAFMLPGDEEPCCQGAERAVMAREMEAMMN